MKILGILKSILSTQDHFFVLTAKKAGLINSHPSVLAVCASLKVSIKDPNFSWSFIYQW